MDATEQDRLRDTTDGLTRFPIAASSCSIEVERPNGESIVLPAKFIRCCQDCPHCQHRALEGWEALALPPSAGAAGLVIHWCYDCTSGWWHVRPRPEVLAWLRRGA